MASIVISVAFLVTLEYSAYSNTYSSHAAWSFKACTDPLYLNYSGTYIGAQTAVREMVDFFEHHLEI